MTAEHLRPRRQSHEDLILRAVKGTSGFVLHTQHSNASGWHALHVSSALSGLLTEAMLSPSEVLREKRFNREPRVGSRPLSWDGRLPLASLGGS